MSVQNELQICVHVFLCLADLVVSQQQLGVHQGLQLLAQLAVRQPRGGAQVAKRQRVCRLKRLAEEEVKFKF